jgi:hypothetical protein
MEGKYEHLFANVQTGQPYTILPIFFPVGSRGSQWLPVEGMGLD